MKYIGPIYLKNIFMCFYHDFYEKISLDGKKPQNFIEIC